VLAFLAWNIDSAREKLESLQRYFERCYARISEALSRQRA
jgi:hypothetical protein